MLLSCGQSRSLEESEDELVLDELLLVPAVAVFELEAASACPTPKAPPNSMAPVRLAPTTTLRIFGARIVITSFCRERWRQETRPIWDDAGTAV